MIKKSIYLLVLTVNLCLLNVNHLAYSQEKKELDNDWHLQNYSDGEYNGINLQALQSYLKKQNKAGQPVIVAILDSGVEVDHEDLKSVMWTNPKEKGNNKSDDDRNNYVDDLHGWNFLGGKNGDNVDADTYEGTRLVALYGKKYANADPNELKKKELAEYNLYKKLKEDTDRSREKAGSQLKELEGSKLMANEIINNIRKYLGNGPLDMASIEKLDKDIEEQANLKNYLTSVVSQTGDLESTDKFEEMITASIDEGIKHYESKYLYAHNPEFSPRNIIGDNINDKYEVGYGNNDYEGPDAFHGTHVAGIVAAARGNDLGMDGVADNVKIMTVRVVPDGDERDKDVANGIRYAVDNGAKVINMSFGKGFSPYKEVVDEAVKYAAKHDVVIVHAAGNSSQDNDVSNNFPNARYAKKGLFSPKSAKNWIEVGALAPSQGKNMVASFSNYGDKSIDIFAPGVQIYSTIPDNSYGLASGTSMASPVVAGAVALLRSHYPDVKAKKIVKAITEGGKKVDQIVIKPGKGNENVKFESLSKNGKILDIYQSYLLLQK